MREAFGAGIGKLGFGLMRLPMRGGEVDIEQVVQMVDAYLAGGFTYFDTAYVYAGGKSESVAKQAIVDRYPRDAYQLATKLPMWQIKKPEDMERIFEEQLRRAGLNYFDCYLLHGLNSTVSDRFPSSDLAKADEMGAWDFLRRKKAEGRTKHIGFSFHDSAEVLDRILTQQPDMEFVQLQMNYADWEDNTIQSRECYEVARKHGKPIVVMEAVKGGTLVNLRPEVAGILTRQNPEASLASWAIRYSASLDGVVTVLSGMQNMEQMRDNISYMKEFRPLDSGEQAVIGQVQEALRNIDAIGCTACRYCVDDCPQEIPIPHIFELVNDYKVFKDREYSKRRYTNATAGTGKASGCIACGACESLCPQKLKIIGLLEEAASVLE